MTGQHIPTGDSVTSVTTECQLYSNLMISDAASWLDTVGWEDRKKEDMESFKEMLRQEAEILGIFSNEVAPKSLQKHL